MEFKRVRSRPAKLGKGLVAVLVSIASMLAAAMLPACAGELSAPQAAL